MHVQFAHKLYQNLLNEFYLTLKNQERLHYEDLLQELGRLLSQVKAQLLPAVNAPEAGAQGAIVFVVIPLQRRRGKGALVAFRYADAEIDPHLLCGARGRQTALEVDDLRQVAGNKAVQCPPIFPEAEWPELRVDGGLDLVNTHGCFCFFVHVRSLWRNCTFIQNRPKGCALRAALRTCCGSYTVQRRRSKRYPYRSNSRNNYFSKAQLYHFR